MCIRDRYQRRVREHNPKSNVNMSYQHPQSDELRGVTGAIRDYSNNASQAEKDKKTGQQQWGLFETNYQRNKGITTDQSLDEIEDFSKNGLSYQAGGGRNTAGSAGSQSSSSFGGSAGSSSSGSSTSGGGFGPGGSSGGGFGPGGATGTSGVAGGGTGRFPEGSGAGAAFFSQHQQRENAKFKPGYRG
eukprot:TRINITY_DN8960_c0_g1_i1.p1 TRINITY_DN8960_c0_g1~~TRINITY_DN8960_c0_g1_i1.p1  ORF type:complete len:188 (+),score=75.62 TRINITY_DN8960_c0_g1_i1:3-566(+)